MKAAAQAKAASRACPNCKGGRKLCRRCGTCLADYAGPAVFDNEYAPCNGQQKHQWVACPECGGEGKV